MGQRPICYWWWRCCVSTQPFQFLEPSVRLLAADRRYFDSFVAVFVLIVVAAAAAVVDNVAPMYLTWLSRILDKVHVLSASTENEKKKN